LFTHSLNRSPGQRSTVRLARRLAERMHDEAGFTLAELLVVVLIIGILAAIAIPSFIAQTGKASDTAAKTQVGTLETTMKLYAMNNNGSYDGATLIKLQTIEPTLKDTTTAIAKEVVTPTTTGYTVESEAVGSNHVYRATFENGAIARSCTPENMGGCKADTW
jgi:type IV pilus assembly protein PilA